jgi:hypothetical protein
MNETSSVRTGKAESPERLAAIIDRFLDDMTPQVSGVAPRGRSGARKAQVSR